MDSPSPHFWHWKALDRRRRRGNRRRIGDSLTRLDREGESSACLFEWRGTPAEAPIEISVTDSGLDRKELVRPWKLVLVWVCRTLKWMNEKP